MKVLSKLIAILALALLTFPALAVEPSEMLQDPALESRAREISEQLRCVVCQNQTIDDSNAPLAHDMRLLVRERLLAGDTNQEVLDYVVDRYGNFVLLRPPIEADTVALWVSPFVVLALAAFGLFAAARNPGAKTAHPLSDEERRRLAARVSGGANGPQNGGV
ncbi:MAG: cytochrome c-type biogenesis protein [Terricaulis sp.]